jgi:sugar lactone lactonase YvrE
MYTYFFLFFHRTSRFLVLLVVVCCAIAAKAQTGPPTPAYLSTYAGTPHVSGNSGNGGSATQAQFAYPEDVAVDAAGNMYIADYSSHVIRKVTPDGLISTVAGNGVDAVSGDGGPATSASIGGPWGVDVDAAGNIYITDQDWGVIRKVTPAGIISTVAGTPGGYYDSGDGGPATSATLAYPGNVAVDAAGDIFISDYDGQRVREVYAATGIISTVAGGGTNGAVNYSGPATGAQLSYMLYVALDASGNLYLTDGITVRKMDPSGNLTTVAGTGGSTAPYNYTGPSVNAGVNAAAIHADPFGNLYITDISTNTIRKVDASGNMSNFAGNGSSGFNGDGGLATDPSAQLGNPQGITGDAAGNVFVAELNNYIVRKIGTLPPPPQAQAITFSDITTTYGSPDFSLTGIASSGLPLTYTIADTTVATLHGNIIHVLQPGTTTLTATQSGDAFYLPATAVTVNLVVNAPNQAITGFTDITLPFGSPDFALVATASSGLPITYTIADPTIALITNGTLHLLQPGVTTITASQPGGGAFTIAVPVTITLLVTQNISLVPITVNYGDPDFALTATPGTSGGGALIFAAVNPAVAQITNGASGSTLHILAADTTTIAVSQAGSTGPPVTALLTITQAPLTITANDTSKLQGDPNPPLTVSYSGFVYDETQSNLTGEPTVVTTAITSSPLGAYPITVSSAATGNYVITYKPGTLTINPVPPVITADKLDAVFAGSTLQVVLESLKTENAALQVIDMTGNILFAREITLNGSVNTYQFPASNIAHGVYIVLVKGNGLKLTDKIIK